MERKELNEEALKGWHKQYLFSYPVSSGRQPLSEEIKDCILGYIVRRLSRGIIPDFLVVQEALQDDYILPSCKHIGCCIEMEHVH